MSQPIPCLRRLHDIRVALGVFLYLTLVFFALVIFYCWLAWLAWLRRNQKDAGQDVFRFLE